jgi:hypothetical protein
MINLSITVFRWFSSNVKNEHSAIVTGTAKYIVVARLQGNAVDWLLVKKVVQRTTTEEKDEITIFFELLTSLDKF